MLWWGQLKLPNMMQQIATLWPNMYDMSRLTMLPYVVLKGLDRLAKV